MVVWAAVVAALVIRWGHIDAIYFDILARFEGGEPGEIASHCVFHNNIHFVLLARRGMRAIFVFCGGVAQ